MKQLALFIIASLLIILSANPLFAQFREGVYSKPDTSLTFQELTNPSFQNLLLTDKSRQSQKLGPGNKPLEFSKVPKILLRIGADLIRGNTGDIPLYDLENGWKYPGPTIQYPTDVTKYERFLSRYDRFNSDS